MLDAIIIGGGFYGAVIAVYLAQQRGLKSILLIDQEEDLLKRASYTNQARIHNGYHYPRSYTTAYRSRVNVPKFFQNWPQAIKKDFVALYAIARRNSKVTAKQFERFCLDVGAYIEPANSEHFLLFNQQLIEKVFSVHEYVFNADKLSEQIRSELKKADIKVRLNTQATHVTRGAEGGLRVRMQSTDGGQEEISSRYVFNCTYSGLNQFKSNFFELQSKLKHEIAEMALIKMPPKLNNLAITVMDGPFFSMMPFPAKNLHTLSHVRYTPHFSWEDKAGVGPYQKLNEYEKITHADRMMRDAGRYMPSILEGKYVESLFEIKTVLLKNESDDGRPILFEKHLDFPGFYSVLGGKIDNLYDVLERLDEEVF